MTVRRSIDPCPASSRPQRLFATASGTGGPPTQRRWRAIRGTSCSRAPGRAGRDELRRGPARRALRLARSRDDGERRTGKGGGQDRQRAPSSSSPAWHPISRVGWAFACVLPAPPPLLPRRDSSALSPMWTAAVAGPVGPHATAPAGYLDPRSPGLRAPCSMCTWIRAALPSEQMGGAYSATCLRVANAVHPMTSLGNCTSLGKGSNRVALPPALQGWGA